MLDVMFGRVLKEILGDEFRYAETTTKYDVLLFDPTGEQQGYQEFDHEEAAENCARRLSALFPELYAHQSSSDSNLVFVYRGGALEGVITGGASA